MEVTELEEYQEFVNGTSSQRGLSWCILGLAAEAGEVAGALEKYLRKADDSAEADEEMRANVLDELGDVLWYAAETCNELGTTLDEVLEHNIQKLNERAKK